MASLRASNRLWLQLAENEPIAPNETPIEQYEVRFNYSARPHCYVVFSDLAIYLLQKPRMKGISFTRRIAKGLLVWADYPEEYSTRAPFAQRGDLIAALGTHPTDEDLAKFRGPKAGLITTVSRSQAERFKAVRQDYGHPFEPIITRRDHRHGR